LREQLEDELRVREAEIKSKYKAKNEEAYEKYKEELN